MRDSFDRDITYLRISVTDKCNLRCTYCMPAEGVPRLRHAELLTLEQMAAVARAAVGLGVAKVRLTGGEPLVKRGIVDLVAMIAGIDGLGHLAMTTNGTLLAPLARPLRAAGLDSINLSLDTIDPDRYRALTRGGDIAEALAGLDAALAAGFPVKVNTVVLEDTPAGELDRLRSFCEARGACLQLINHFQLEERKRDQYAFDRPPSCDRCNRIRLTADGRLKPCLHSDEEVRLDFDRLEDSLREAILGKPRRGGACTGRTMAQIGG
jgi:cyclic pyranopterin phosphate synthase